MNETDQQLLRSYAKDRAEDIFAEIVRRHLDLVYSAALRQVQSPQLAKDVSQSVFTDLARSAGSLKHDTVLSAWLYEVTRRTAIDVIRKEARRQLREQLYTEMNAINATTEDWRNILPHLDDAMAELDSTDRAAVLLRFFENKSLREVGQELGVSDDAAQKRVSRAVERLREYFAKHGVTVGTGGLVALVSANAVQAAPVGLAITVSTAAVLGGSAMATAVVKTIAMTTLQKTLIVATIASLAGTGIYEFRQASNLASEVKTLRQQQAPLAAQLNELQREHEALNSQLAIALEETKRWKSGGMQAELLKLRSDVGLLAAENQRLGQLFEAEFVRVEKDPTEMRAKRWLDRVKRFREELAKVPEKSIPELKLLTDKIWLDVARSEGTSTDPAFGLDQAFAQLRKAAKEEFGKRLSRALRAYATANGNQLPPDTLALKPYFVSPVEDATLERYEILRSGELKSGEPLIAERAVVDQKYDTLFKIGADRFWFQGVGDMGGESGSQSWTGNDLPLNIQAEQEIQAHQAEEKLQQSLRDDVESEADDLDERILERAAKECLASLSGRKPENLNFSNLLPYLRTPIEKAAFERLMKRHGDW
jgi:RNA polymerase sigma factor (sigma-70 family)